MMWWRTLHSTAARELGVGGGDLVVRDHWDEIGRAMEMQFGDLDEGGRPSPFRRGTGHRVQSCYYLRRARMQPMDETELEYVLGSILAPQVRRFHKTIEAYKKSMGLLDYADLIQKAPGAIGVRVVFVDEAQDLTAAQWTYVDRLWRSVDRAYVAGDDEQAIFTWAGADVSRFLNVPGERIVLDVSHRLPRTAYRVARRVSNRIRVKQPKKWCPTGREGEVHRAVLAEQLPLVDGDWLLLSRTRSGLKTWENACKNAAVRFVSVGVDSVRPEELRAIRAWERARAGRDDVDPDDLSAAQTMADVSPGLDSPIWREALTGIPKARRLYYGGGPGRGTSSMVRCRHAM